MQRTQASIILIILASTLAQKITYLARILQDISENYHSCKILAEIRIDRTLTALVVVPKGLNVQKIYSKNGSITFSLFKNFLQPIATFKLKLVYKTSVVLYS